MRRGRLDGGIAGEVPRLFLGIKVLNIRLARQKIGGRLPCHSVMFSNAIKLPVDRLAFGVWRLIAPSRVFWKKQDGDHLTIRSGKGGVWSLNIGSAEERGKLWK